MKKNNAEDCSVVKELFSVESSNRIDIIKGVCYTPQNQEIKGLVQVLHGMCDSIKRYDEFMRYLADSGYIVFGGDCIGHGETAPNDNMRGFFAKKDGHKYLIEDTYKITMHFKEKFKDTYNNLPFIMVSHSMGSLIARNYVIVKEYAKEIDKIVFLGSPPPMKIAYVGIFLSKLLQKIHGEKYVSKLLNKLSVDNYNKQFKPCRTANDWLTRDEELVDISFLLKENCFKFTVSAFADLAKLNINANSEKWFREYPKELPCLFMTGFQDPVTNNGKGTRLICEKLEKNGFIKGTFMGYFNARHELLNETNRQQVYSDIKNWIENV